MKKFISRVVSFVLVFTVIVSPTCSVFANSIEASISDISEAEAKIIAENFVRDMSNNDFCSWNTETSIKSVTYLYNLNDIVSAYCVNFNTGYVVVAAKDSYESLIMEWSDEGEAVFQNGLNIISSKIIYLGGLSYFYDLSDNLCESMDNVIINKSKLTDGWNLIPQKSNYVSYNSVIEDPVQNANANYAGPFTCVEYSNLWSNYTTNPFICEDYSEYKNHCGPIAVSNLIWFYGLKNNVYDVIKYSKSEIFNKVVTCGENNLYYLNNKLLGGTSDIQAGNYIKKAYNLFNINVTIQSRKSIDYTNIKSTLIDGNLAYLLLVNHEVYGKHHVACYAYTRLQSSSTGAYKTYLKIADGWGKTGRYLDLASLNGMKYWPVILP